MPISNTAYLAPLFLGVLGVCRGGLILTDWHGLGTRLYDRRVDPATQPGGRIAATGGFEKFQRRVGWSSLVVGVLLLVLGVAAVL
jgi:hypothetical protein